MSGENVLAVGVGHFARRNIHRFGTVKGPEGVSRPREPKRDVPFDLIEIECARRYEVPQGDRVVEIDEGAHLERFASFERPPEQGLY